MFINDQLFIITNYNGYSHKHKSRNERERITIFQYLNNNVCLFDLSKSSTFESSTSMCRLSMFWRYGPSLIYTVTLPLIFFFFINLNFQQHLSRHISSRLYYIMLFIFNCYTVSFANILVFASLFLISKHFVPRVFGMNSLACLDRNKFEFLFPFNVFLVDFKKQPTKEFCQFV